MNKILVFPKTEIKRELPLNFNKMKNGKFNYIKSYDSFSAIYILRVKNAFVSPYGIAFKNGKVINESVYSMFKRNNNILTFYKKLLLLRVKFLKENAVVMHNAFYDNYYHFTSESLSRLFLVKDLIKNSVILLPINAPNYIKEYLHFFEFKEIKYIKLTDLAFTKSLILPMHTANGLTHRPEIMNQMRDWFSSKNILLKEKYIDYTNVYLSRSKARWRRVVNEPEVVKLLLSYNFKIINLEDYSVKEQIAIFNNVQNLVGVHGAGLTNIIHMPPQSLFLSFIHEDHRDPAFYNLATALSQLTIIMECEGERDNRGNAYNDIYVSITDLKNYLDLYLKKQPLY